MTNPLRFLPLALLFAFSSCTAEVPTEAPAENPERLPEVRYYVVADT